MVQRVSFPELRMCSQQERRLAQWVSDKLGMHHHQNFDCLTHSLSLGSSDEENEMFYYSCGGFEMFELNVYLPYWERHEGERREVPQNSIQYCDLE